MPSVCINAVIDNRFNQQFLTQKLCPTSVSKLLLHCVIFSWLLGLPIFGHFLINSILMRHRSNWDLNPKPQNTSQHTRYVPPFYQVGIYDPPYYLWRGLSSDDIYNWKWSNHRWTSKSQKLRQKKIFICRNKKIMKFYHRSTLSGLDTCRYTFHGPPRPAMSMIVCTYLIIIISYSGGVGTLGPLRALFGNIGINYDCNLVKVLQWTIL